MRNVVFELTIATLLAPTLYAQKESRNPTLSMSTSSCVEIIVIDPLGRVTGRDGFTRQYYRQIPEASFGYDGVSDDEDANAPSRGYSVFITGYDYPPVNGTYRIRLVGVRGGGNYRFECTAIRADSVSRFEVGGSIASGSVVYYNLEYSDNPATPLSLERVSPTAQISGGIFNPSGSTLTVKVKASINFTSGNSLKTLVATIRWLTSYGVTLGAVESSLGFQKWDSVGVSGNYSYQKFRMVNAIPIDWQANTEYELFSVPVGGGTGVGDFQLTNSIPGGEWYVDVDYSDKTDSGFYHGSDH